MRSSFLAVVLLALAAVGSFAMMVVAAPSSTAQEIDEEVPPGNPVIGDTRPGDIEPESTTRYGLWGLVAVCLIGAGVLLVKIERWEATRTGRSDWSDH